MTNNKIYDITPLLGKVHNCDCLDFMRQLPDKCIDLVLTDPPYGINLEYGEYKDTPENLKQIVGPLMEQTLRISKRAMITPGINNVCLYPQPKWIIAWVYGTTNTWGGVGF